MEETIKHVELVLDRVLTVEEKHLVQLAHLVAYEKGKESVWNLARQTLGQTTK
jgi:hypothetical protein